MASAKVLVVDDDYDFAEFAKMLLESSGYEVIVALNPVLGLKLAAQEKPALILMDFAMKEMDGIEAIRRLKASPETMVIPVILCSADRTSAELSRAMAAGAADHIKKPLKREDISATVSRYIAPASSGNR